MAGWTSVDRYRGRDASGMPDPEVCVCCWVDFRLPGMLADEKMREKTDS